MTLRERLLTDPGRLHPPKGWRRWGWKRLAQWIATIRVRKRKALRGETEFQSSIREKMLEICQWAIQYEPEIHYSQSRPIPMNLPFEHKPLNTDCSGSTTIFAKWAGAPDPNGLGYSGYGYTGSMAKHLHQITLAQAKVGDLVIFGNPITHHVAVIIQTGTDPILESHGFEGAPIRIALSSEAKYHRNEGGYRFFSLL